jgi:hypothetical protein
MAAAPDAAAATQEPTTRAAAEGGTKQEPLAWSLRLRSCCKLSGQRVCRRSTIGHSAVASPPKPPAPRKATPEDQKVLFKVRHAGAVGCHAPIPCSGQSSVAGGARIQLLVAAPSTNECRQAMAR